MNKNLRWRVVVIRRRHRALSVWAFYPPDQKIKLGLDLKGGVHLVLRVQTDDALRLETETTVERLREALTTRRRGRHASSKPPSPTQFVVEGIPNDQALPRRRRRRRHGLRPRSRAPAALHLHDEAEHREPAARARR